MTTRGSKIDTLVTFYAGLNEEFKAVIEERISLNRPGSSLLRLLKVGSRKVDIPFALTVGLMKYRTKYRTGRNDAFCFEFNGVRMDVTLEDVLFLTGLSITGKPVCPTNSRDTNAFQRVFGIDVRGHLSLTTLTEIAKNVNRSEKQRLIAVLLLIISCTISADHHKCYTSYVEFVEELEMVETYAWGAALLARLYRGFRDFKPEKPLMGNTWLLVGCLLCHIPRLRDALKIELKAWPPGSPFLASVIEACSSIGHNHQSTLKIEVDKIFATLSDQEIVWRPYRAEMLPHHSLTCQVPFRTLLAPLFCYNFVENHTPHVVAKQFKVFDAVEDLSLVGNFLGPIKTKENRGPEGTNYLKVYKQKLNLWEEKTLGGFESEPDLTDASMDEILLMLNPNHNAGSSGEDSHVPNNSSFREDSPGPNNTFREDSPGRNTFRSPGPSKEVRVGNSQL